MTKKSRQKFKYLENENNFQGKVKSIFHHFKELLGTKSVPELSQIVSTSKRFFSSSQIHFVFLLHLELEILNNRKVSWKFKSRIKHDLRRYLDFLRFRYYENRDSIKNTKLCF